MIDPTKPTDPEAQDSEAELEQALGVGESAGNTGPVMFDNTGPPPSNDPPGGGTA